MRIVLTTWLLGAAFAIAFCATALASCNSANVVGYVNANVKHGSNTIGMPEKVSGEPQRVEDVIQGLVDGDKIFVIDRFDRECWGEVIEDDDGKHVYVEGYEAPIDDWELPSVGGEQILKVKRAKDVETLAPLAGEFNCEVPFQLPEYTGDAPLSKIKISKETIKNLLTVVTVTNSFAVAVPVTMSKKFELILKDGRRIVVRVDQNTQVIVDDKTGEPVNVVAREVERFGEIKCADIPKREKAVASEIHPVANDIQYGTRAYDINKAMKEGLIGVVWDEDHKLMSIVTWSAIVAFVSFVNKVLDGLWGKLGAAIVCFFTVWFLFFKAVAIGVASVGRFILFYLKSKIFGTIRKYRNRRRRRPQVSGSQGKNR